MHGMRHADRPEVRGRHSVAALLRRGAYAFNLLTVNKAVAVSSGNI